MVERKINIGINHGREAFYANGVSISLHKSTFTLDFRQTVQKVDDIADKPQTTFFTSHNTLIIEPQMAKGFLDILKQSIENYEKQFGKIKVEKKPKKSAEVEDVKLIKSDNYIG
ncbi:MAG: DUF3467 domain-containing protein [Candidatus Woesearchaeota archaeon]|nr:MAG: DUF3467 domain-containing protein [Candidatus Woesearchaeota archaeon]